MKHIMLIANIIIGIVLSLVLVIVPIEKTTTVWVAYIFTILALIINSSVSVKKRKSELSNLSLVYTGFTYLAVQVVILVLTMIFPSIPAWIILIFNIVVLAIAILISMILFKSSNYIIKIDEKNKTKRFFVKEIEVELNLIINDEDNAELKKKMMKISELIRFSDPISNEYVELLEDEIKYILNEISNNTHDKGILLDTLDKKLKERNQKINLYK